MLYVLWLTLVVKLRWLTGRYVVHGRLIPDISKYRIGPGIRYESYMRRWPIREPKPGKKGVGVHLIVFPPGTAEDNKLHTHPASARIVVIVEGEGIFETVRRGKREVIYLKPEDAVYLDKGKLHTFRCMPEQELVVVSTHIPNLPEAHPLYLVYPKEAK